MDLSTISQIDRTLRNAKRYQEILSVLAKHGFQEFVVESGIGRWVQKEFKVDISINGAGAHPGLSKEVRLKKVIEELGPTFIKVGQILSTRPDLIPQSFADEFKNLQSDVERVPFPLIEKRLNEEFPGRLHQIFPSIDETPIAAASLAQAHSAVLADGTRVVLKILKPGARELIEADIGVISSFANFIEKSFQNTGFRPREVAAEFARQLEREVDFLHEGRSTERLRSYFVDDQQISFPEVYFDASTRNVLALELIDGELLARLDIKSLSSEDRQAIIQHGADAVFRQCFEIGFFHADPHPGNIMILPGNHVCFLDCGMTGQIDRRTSEQLADLVSGIVQSDLDRVIEVIIALTESDLSLATQRAFRNEVWEFISRFQNSTFATLDVGNLLDDFFALLRRNELHCPADIVMLIKAITTIEGVAEEIDPSFDIVGYVEPYLENFVIQRFGPRALARRTRKTLVSYAELLEELPVGIRTVLDRLKANRFPINVEHRGLEEFNRNLAHLGNSVSSALIVAALLVGSAILILAERVSGEAGIMSKMGMAGFFTAVVMTVVIIFNNYGAGRK